MPTCNLNELHIILHLTHQVALLGVIPHSMGALRSFNIA